MKAIYLLPKLPAIRPFPSDEIHQYDTFSSNNAEYQVSVKNRHFHQNKTPSGTQFLHHEANPPSYKIPDMDNRYCKKRPLVQNNLLLRYSPSNLPVPVFFFLQSILVLLLLLNIPDTRKPA